MKKLAVFMSHPIQYQVPLLKKMAQSQKMDVHTYFFWNFGVEESYDVEFKVKIKWDIPILEGYKHTFLKNYSPKPSSSFWGQINPGAIREIFTQKYDAVLIFGWALFSNWLVVIAALLTRTPIILQAESPLNQELLKQGWKQKIKKIILKQFFRAISYFAYIGQENKKFFKSYGISEDKLFFTPYAVNNEKYFKDYAANKKTKAELREKHSIDPNRPVLLFVGKLFEKKRPWTLLKAYHQLVSENGLAPAPSLVFVGDGEFKNDMIKYKNEHQLDHVHFVGFKNQLELPEFYLLSDLFVLPSGVGETWGLVVNEAMCFGLPVVVSHVVGCSYDLVRNSENGYIFELDQISDLKEKLYNILSAADDVKKFGIKSQEIVKNYSHENDVSTYERILSQHER